MNIRPEPHRQLIQRVLRMDDEAYTSLVYEQGVRYVQLYLQGDGLATRVMLERASYWQWWRRQWALRDLHFARENQLEQRAPIVDRWERSLLKKLYIMTNDAEWMEMRIARHVVNDYIKVLRNQ